MGCDTRRFKVPLFFSALIESKPKISPMNGPIRAISDIYEGIELPPVENSFKNIKLASNEAFGSAAASLSALPMPVTAP